MRRLGRSDSRRRCGFCLGCRGEVGPPEILQRPPGLKPAFILDSYAALKRRSSTVLSCGLDPSPS
jgi:hypothetical protein